MNKIEVVEKKEVEPIKKAKGYKKKADPNSKPVKYLKNRMQGMNKSDAQLEAGYADIHHGIQIESTKTYENALTKYLADEPEVARELNKNIRQDDSLSAKNRAIDIYIKAKNLYPTEQTDLEGATVKVIISKEKEE